MSLILVDHYDSFTYNVLDWLWSAGFVVEVVAYDDQARMGSLLHEAAGPLVLSPGPKRPEDAPSTLVLAREALGRVPILGICLGHQILAHMAGAAVIPARQPFHGSTRLIHRTSGRLPQNTADDLFKDLPPSFVAATYNSLVVSRQGLGDEWRVIAVDDDDDVQAIAWEKDGHAPAYGVQFHPESFLSRLGGQIAHNFSIIVKRHLALRETRRRP